MTQAHYLKQLFGQSGHTDDIYDVIGRMEMLIEFFKKSEFEGINPFLVTYQLVTKSVVEHGARLNYFEDLGKIQELDVVFADLFFKPAHVFVTKQKLVTPWKTFFEYNSEKLPAFAKLLLGINAHINGDLAHALHKSKYNSKADFDKVNDILLEVIPDVMKYLIVNQRDLFGLGGILAPEFYEREFRHIVVEWRNQAWINFEVLKSDKSKLITLHKQTEMAGEQIVKIFSNIHRGKILNVLDDLEKIKIEI